MGRQDFLCLPPRQIHAGCHLRCPLSPRLGNFILDGLQNHIRQYLSDHHRDSNDFSNGAIVRYADDVIAAARTQEDAEIILDAIRAFFKSRGLTMSERKTDILDLTEESFTFLSCTYTKIDSAVRIFPSQEAIYALESSIREYIASGRHSQRNLILELNKKLTGWSSFFRYTDAADAFREIDIAVQALLLKSLTEKYPRLSNEKIRDRFWYEEKDGHYVFALPEDKTIRLKELKDVLLMTHDLPPYKFKYYLNREYFENRKHADAPRYINGKYKSVLNRQGLCCAICKRPILPDQDYEAVPLDDSKKKSITNTQYVPSLTLTFKDIEDIESQPLPLSAYKYASYWYQHNTQLSIAETWNTEGYHMIHLSLRNNKIKLKRAVSDRDHLHLPKWLSEDKIIPRDARNEIEKFLDYIGEKYSL